VLFGVGGWMLMTENFTIGLYTALMLFINNFTSPVTELVSLGQSIQTLKIDMSRIDDVMKNPIDPLFITQEGKEGEIKRLEGYLEMRNVSYGYSLLDPPFIENFNLKLAPGQRVALVGPSGCGKTTVGRLISGLIHPWTGEILYDGKSRLEHSREDLTGSLATIDQEIFLFSGTIKDNITLYDRTISDEEIIHAAKAAGIHDEIVQKPGGYSYVLTEGGMNFGGGQRQRLEIARGLLLNPRILILDEATSSLDTKTEEVIVQNIRHRSCTCIMVAHRLSSIRDCDEIIVLDHGKIIQRGTHDDLKNLPGTYRELVKTGNL
jgi:ABC-type bacteriocin/lantibiotic exporter with double-glycine peptidase domain